MIPNRYTDFYGDNMRWFIGVVKNIDDPLELGRVQVKIFGIHEGSKEDIPDADLPYAQVVMPISAAGIAGLGNNLGIQVSARVFGIFLDGKNSQDPLVLGSLPKIEEESDGEITNVTTSKLARGEHIDEVSKKTIDGNIAEPEQPFAAKYPDNKVIATPGGHVIEVDDTDGAERLHIFHRTGTFVEIHPNGDMVTHTKGMYNSINGVDNRHVVEDMELVADKDYTMTVRGDLNIQVGGEVRINGDKINLNSGTTVLKGKILIDDPIPYTPEFIEMLESDVPPEHPFNEEEKGTENTVTEEKSPVTCGQTPQQNPFDVASALQAQGGWEERNASGARVENKQIEFLWNEIGYPGASNRVSNGTAWCATFIGAVLKRSGNKYKQTARSREYENYGVEVPLAQARKGDIVVFYRKGKNSGFGHVGVFTGNKTSSTIEVLGGNQRIAGSKVKNDGLTTKSYQISGSKFGVLSVRRAVSCSDGTTEAPVSGSTNPIVELGP